MDGCLETLFFFGWILSVVIAFVVSRLVLSINDPLLQIDGLLLLLIIAVGLCVVVYVNNFKERYFRYFDFIQSMPTETTMIKFLLCRKPSPKEMY